MNRDTFLKMLRSHPGWGDMKRKGKAGMMVYFRGVEFFVFRDNAFHYLRKIPRDETTLAVVKEFNALMCSVRKELERELYQCSLARLTRDDNEGDR